MRVTLDVAVMMLQKRTNRSNAHLSVSRIKLKNLLRGHIECQYDGQPNLKVLIS